MSKMKICRRPPRLAIRRQRMRSTGHCRPETATCAILVGPLTPPITGVGDLVRGCRSVADCAGGRSGHGGQ